MTNVNITISITENYILPSIDYYMVLKFIPIYGNIMNPGVTPIKLPIMKSSILHFKEQSI